MSSWKTAVVEGQPTTSRALTVLQCGHDDVVVEDGPPRGRLQNSGLRGVPREPAACGVFRKGAVVDAGRKQTTGKRLVRSERGSRVAFFLTNELPKNLGRECGRVRVSRRRRSLRSWRKKIVPGSRVSAKHLVMAFRRFSSTTTCDPGNPPPVGRVGLGRWSWSGKSGADGLSACETPELANGQAAGTKNLGNSERMEFFCVRIILQLAQRHDGANDVERQLA